MSDRTYIYVDGFNLYYRAVKDTPYRWLDLKALFQSVLWSTNEIEAINYYTADVSGKHDRDAPRRQKAYLRALRTIPEVSIYKGSFLVSKKWAGLATSPRMFVYPRPRTVRIIRTEEKGSDVNLASHLLADGFNKRYDVAVVVSNDTDLVEPIRIVVRELKIPVGLICPSPSPARSLKAVASFIRNITARRLAAAQFPDPIPGTTIAKPAAW